jgi:Family of unknown function (DUF6134)
MFQLALGLSLLSVLSVADDERTFSVTIDGQRAGELVVNFEARPDGESTVKIRADYRADRHTPIAFEYRGAESWKDGRLTRLEGLGAENGRKGGITLVAGKEAYALKAGVKEVSIRDPIWPTSGVTPPGIDGKLLAVDVITGDVLRTKVEQEGSEQITAAGKLTTVTRYRVTAGGNRWDLWYDERQRLVKRVWTRDGRTVTAELSSLKGD